MAFQTALPRAIPFAGGAGRRRAAAPRGTTLGALLARYGAWLRRLDDAARLREMEPRLARDIGVAAGGDRAPAGFALDPRPLWGIGLTPQPTLWCTGRPGGSPRVG